MAGNLCVYALNTLLSVKHVFRVAKIRTKKTVKRPVVLDA